MCLFSESGPCPPSWSCIKYSDCSQFDNYVERGGLFADLRCSSDQLSWVCCDPQGEWEGFGTELTDDKIFHGFVKIFYQIMI